MDTTVTYATADGSTTTAVTQQLLTQVELEGDPMVDAKPELITPEVARLMAIAAARFAYRDWDANEAMDAAVERGEYRLNEMLAGYGLTNGEHDDLLDWISEAYLDAVSDLFGGPSIR